MEGVPTQTMGRATLTKRYIYIKKPRSPKTTAKLIKTTCIASGQRIITEFMIGITVLYRLK